MDNSYLKSDRSIKPKHMAVGDLVVGHHEGDPHLLIPEIWDQGKAVSFRGPYEVVLVLPQSTDDRSDGVHYRSPMGGTKRYCEYNVRSQLWIIVRDRPGIPRFIEDYPDRCVKCKGKIYVGLHEVVHERGNCAA